MLAPPVSLRTNVVWTFAGNAVYAASQWLILSLIAKLGNAEMLGQYALAMAITAPVVMFSHLNLRTVLVTDMKGRHPAGDYLAVRFWTVAAGLGAIAAVALVSRYPQTVAAVIVLLGAAQSLESTSDIYYGLLQRRERMDRIAGSMIGRGVLSAAALGVTLWLTRSLVYAVMALALSRLATLLAYDRPAGSAGEDTSRRGARSQLEIARTALPLGVVLMLASLNTNLPRYAIEHFLGTRELGAFAAVASFVTVGTTMINALGQAAAPRLARYASGLERARFRKLAFELSGLAVLLGLAGVVVAALLGRWALALVYRQEYAVYRDLLIAVMSAAMLQYLAIMLGYIITSTRAFVEQIPLLSTVTAAAAAASWLLIPWLGLVGAALVLGVTGGVQAAGAALILKRAMRGMESAA